MKGVPGMQYTPKLFTELKTYTRDKFTSDLFAGMTVGVVALPLAMAFAIASGLPPERGLFTAVVAGFLISALGGSRVQIGGPTGAFVVIVSGIVTQYGYNGLVLCTIMAGLFLILFGLCRMGGLIRFIPFPVTTGFTTGIALIIFSTQIGDLLGLRMEEAPGEFLEKWSAYFNNIHSINIHATGISAVTIAVILLTRRYFPRIPAMLAGMVVATLIVQGLGLDVETIGKRFGELPRTLPLPQWPAFHLEDVQALIKPAFTVALLAAIESLLSATVADGMIGGRHRSNVELIGQGVANIASAVFGGIPATGAIARTATNVKSGARTPVAGLIHAVVLALLLLVFAPIAKQIPLAALAGILVIVSYNMSETHHFVAILKGPRSDALVLILTFGLTVLVDLTVAVQVGVVLASLLFMRRMAELSDVRMITRELRGDEDLREDPNAIALLAPPPGVEIFEVTGAFFFGMVDRFRSAVRIVEAPIPVMVVRIRNVLALDATAIHVIRELHQALKKDGTQLVFSGVHTQPLAAFVKSGLLDEIGPENFLGNIDDALNRAREIMGLPTVPRRESFVPTVSREAHLATAPPKE